MFCLVSNKTQVCYWIYKKLTITNQIRSSLYRCWNWKISQPKMSSRAEKSWGTHFRWKIWRRISHASLSKNGCGFAGVYANNWFARADFLQWEEGESEKQFLRFLHVRSCACVREMSKARLQNISHAKTIPCYWFAIVLRCVRVSLCYVRLCPSVRPSVRP